MWGLKKLIATCYNGSTVSDQELSLYPDEAEKTTRVAHKIVITEVKDYNGDGAIDLEDVRELLAREKSSLSKLDGNGDFRSEECIELLKEADIVCTNPPHSLFREYLAQLFEYNKKFLILGNINAAPCKETFAKIKENKLSKTTHHWCSYTSRIRLTTSRSFFHRDLL